MPSTVADTNTSALVVEVKRLDPGLVNRTSDYPGLVKGTNVLVTTGGAVATATVSQLKSAGCKVTVLGTIGSAATASTAEQDCVVVDGSVMSPDDCAKAVAGQAVVVHAGRPPTDACCAGALAQGTRNLLEAAAAAGVRAFVYGSSARCCLFVGVGGDAVGVGPAAGGSCVVPSFLRLLHCCQCSGCAWLAAVCCSQDGGRDSVCTAVQQCCWLLPVLGRRCVHDLHAFILFSL